MKSIAAGL